MADVVLEIFERSDGLFDWRLVAGNGEIVCGTDQGFTTAHDTERAIQRARLLMAEADVVRLR